MLCNFVLFTKTHQTIKISVEWKTYFHRGFTKNINFIRKSVNEQAWEQSQNKIVQTT